MFPTPVAADSNTHPKYRKDIDGLRAVAILAVLGFHVLPRVIRGGYVGVDIFFVISGVLISTILFKGIAGNSLSYKEFYARRIRRIFPALISVLVVSLAAGWALLYPYEYKLLGKHVAAGVGFISNLALWKESGYFDTSANQKIMQHLWSLGIEEQFYIVWPLFIIVSWKNPRRLLWGLILLSFASFCVNVETISSHQTAAFYLPVTRFWELLMGGILAYLTVFESNHHGRSNEFISNVTSCLGLLLIAASLILIDETRAFPGWWALLPTCGTFLMIAAGSRAWINRHILSNRVLVYVGLISYPLYLWHWPVLTFARIVENGVPSKTIRIGAVLVSFILADLTYRFIERPVRSGRFSFGKPLTLGLALFVVGLIGYAVYRSDGASFRKLNFIRNQEMDWIPTSLDDPHVLPQAQTCSSMFPRTVDACARGTLEPTIAVFGDSHAGHLYIGLLDHEAPVMVAWNGGCPPMDDFDADYSCKRRWKSLQDFVKNDKNIRTVILAADYSLYLNEKPLAGDNRRQFKALTAELAQERPGQDIATAFYLGLSKSISSFQRMGVRVGVILDTPPLPYSPVTCLPGRVSFLAGGKNPCEVPKTFSEQVQRAEKKIIKKILQRNKDVKVFDPTPFLCDEKSCHAVVDKKLVYWDSNHLNREGSNLLATPLLAWLRHNFPR